MRNRLLVGVAMCVAVCAAAAWAQNAAGGLTVIRAGTLIDGTSDAPQVHWRDRRLASDWDTLKAQVRRWQASVGLTWGEDDVVEVARYLNDAIYHFPQTSDRKG